ncbi:hypothetical protein HZC53_04565 [Candidatus Uhrbacteria bacterium]|nr:hypothetical protein [Candidatus Uhrbacteria bacterium]
MAIKRQNQSPRRGTAKTEVPSEIGVSVQPATKATTRVRRAPSKPREVRSQTPPPDTYQSSTFLSREEKRQIILAHANMRRPHDPVQMMSMWAGVLACLVVVAVGWWWTVRPEIGRQIESSVKPAMAQVSSGVQDMRASIGEISPGGLTQPLKEVDAKVKQLRDQTKAQKDALDAMSELMDRNATGTTQDQGRDIFTPQANSAAGGE